MHMILIQFKRYDQDSSTDICVVRNKPIANKYTKSLVDQYPSYRCGEFFFKKIKYIRGV